MLPRHRLAARRRPRWAVHHVRAPAARPKGRRGCCGRVLRRRPGPLWPTRPRRPGAETDQHWATYEPYRHAGIRFTLELARDAAACIVTSQRARAMLEFDAGPLELLPSV